MRWTPDRGDIDDERASGAGGAFSGLGLGGMHFGLGGLVLLLVLSWATGTNLFSLLGLVSDSPSGSLTTRERAASSPREEREVDLVGAVAKDVQATWATILGDRYEPTKVRIFRDAIQSACGLAQSATGPFYCPGDQLVYLDVGFFDELRDRFGAPGDFAQAYVIAHEFGHHVQKLTGIEARVRASQRRQPSAGNALSVRLELQADCYAGVWGHAASQSGRAARGEVELDAGDTDEGLRAAAAIGDDRLQRMSTGHVAPDSFTHGTSAQRVQWFRRGLEAGTVAACDTFGSNP